MPRIFVLIAILLVLIAFGAGAFWIWSLTTQDFDHFDPINQKKAIAPKAAPDGPANDEDRVFLPEGEKPALDFPPTTDMKEFHGEVVYGRHIWKLQSGEAYFIEATGEGFRPHVSDGYSGGLGSVGNEFDPGSQKFAGHFSVPFDENRHFHVSSGLLNNGAGKLDLGSLPYTLRIKRVVCENEPVLDVTDAWTAKDPSDRFGEGIYYKRYSVKLSANRVYVIILKCLSSPSFTTELRVEGEKKEKLAYAYGCVGHAQIVYRPQKDREIIVFAAAATPGKTGKLHLHVGVEARGDPIDVREFKGTVSFGSHAYEVKAGGFYFAQAIGAGWHPFVELRPGFGLEPRWDLERRQVLEGNFLAKETGSVNLFVLMGGSFDRFTRSTHLKYSLRVGRVQFEEKPVLEVSDELTAKDPILTRGPRGYYKRYTLKMTNDRAYLCEFLSDPMSKLTGKVAIDSKDIWPRAFGMGDRLYWCPSEDGEVGITAYANESNMTGPFRLRVREQALGTRKP